MIHPDAMPGVTDSTFHTFIQQAFTTNITAIIIYKEPGAEWDSFTKSILQVSTNEYEICKLYDKIEKYLNPYINNH